MSYFTHDQVAHLLKPIAPGRVLGLKKGSSTLSYVAQHDIRAHMNRVFGFGRWSTDVLETNFLFEGEENGRWKAGYSATVKVTVYAPDGTEVAHYTDSHASGNAPQPDRAEAHALALTTAVSTAMKRACTCLGDQFGLSLYNKGQTGAFVKTTLIGSTEAGMTEDVKVVSLGDEVDTVDEGGPAPDETPRSTVDQAASAPATPPEDVQSAVNELRVFATLTAAGERIIQVAKWKQENEALMQYTTPMGDQEITLGVLADQVAAGKFTKAE